MTKDLIAEDFNKARARNQPYINLTNRILSLDEIATVDNLKSIFDLQLSSLYFCTNNINLDKQLANFISKLTVVGIKEILLFSKVENKLIAKESFNKFLDEYKIHINFRMLEIDQKDFSAIRDDIYGKRDILAIDYIEDYKLIYKDGFSISLLNSKESNKIILQNSNYLRDLALDNNSFALKEPEYIQKSEEDAKKRIKDLDLLDKKHSNLEVSHQIDFSVEINQEFSKEQEIDLDLDLEQADYKFNGEEARAKARELGFTTFFDQYMKGSFFYHPDFSLLLDKIFGSDNRIKFITKDALNLVVKNYAYFDNGIDINNMPIGFAFKEGIIFASTQRPSTMPINEFTVKLDNVAPFITNPLKHSWLKYASKGSISLNDIYGTEDAPEIYGFDQHPFITSNAHIMSDIMLDIPSNYENSIYTDEYIENGKLNPFKDNFEKIATNLIHMDPRFGQIIFPNLSEKNKARLDEIYNNLKQRSIEKIFISIIISNSPIDAVDGGFLLEEKTTLFLIKLFEEILPLSENNQKLLFFQNILADRVFKIQSNLQDIFEALHGFYTNFLELLIKQDAEDEYKAKAFAKAIEIIRDHVSETTSLKSILGRFNNILEINESKGGNLIEQLEYLVGINARKILSEPSFCSKAKFFGLSVIHESLALEQYIDQAFEEDLSSSKLISKIYNQNHHNYPSYYNYYYDEALIHSLLHLSTLASHQRASIDSYAKHFYNLNNPSLYKTNGCNPRSYTNLNIDENLKTIDYVESNILGYQYKITPPMLVFYAGNKVDLVKYSQDKVISPVFLLISVDNYDIEILLRFHDKTERIKFSEYSISPQEINIAKSLLVNNSNPDGEIYKLSLAEISFFSLINLETISNKVKDFFAANEHKNDGQNYIDNQTIYIVKSNDHYDLYINKEFNDHLILDKSTINEKLNNKIIDAMSKNDKKIILLPSDIKNSVFENYTRNAYLLNKEDIKKQADNNLEKLTKLLQEATQENVNDFCYAAVSVIAQNANLVNNFTTIQAAANVKLLSLNVLSSSGRYYDASYPTGEFDSYISLFNTLFTNVKIYENQKIASLKLKAHEDYNYKEIYITNERQYFISENTIIQKEAQHKKIIDNFLLTFYENPEFNFGQTVALGLVRNLDFNLGLKTIKNAKILLSYNEYFSQMLRVILATPISENDNVDELNLRTNSIANIINKLADIHRVVTNNGKNPENLVFYAALFAKDEHHTIEQLNTIISKLDHLDQDLKGELLNAFSKCKLPFDYSKIAQSYFPILSFEALDNKELLAEIIGRAKENFVSNEFATRFNNLDLSLMENALIDLSYFEQKYDVKLSNELKNLTFRQLKDKILISKDFIQKEFNISKNDPQKIIDASKYLLYIMLKTISKHDTVSQDFLTKLVELLFDSKKQLAIQLLNIEENKKSLDLLFKDKNTDFKNKFIDLLQESSNIPKENFYEILTFLKSLKAEALAAKNLTILDLLENGGNKIIGKHFDSFVRATNYYLEYDISTNLEDLYSKIKNLEDAKYSRLNIRTIISYCISNNNFDSINIYTKLNGTSDNIEEIIKFLTQITPHQLYNINNDLGANLEILLTLKDILKMELIAEIVLDYKDTITKQQYSLLIEKARSNNQDYIKLLHNFLLTKVNFPKEDKIKIIFDNINSIQNAQIIFSDKNIERFDYEEERIKTQISEVKFLNEDKNLSEDHQKQIYEYFQNIIAKAKNYRFFDSNILHDQAINLKHDRSLAKDAHINEILNIDLEFLAISLEMMFRETGIFPRDTQIIVIINSILQDRHIIEQIATGEGKTITTALHASYLWFTGQTVDIVTSNRELAVRDLLEFYNYYQRLGINMSKETIKPDSEIDIYKKGGINYSTSSDLALFRANREFSSDLDDKSLNTDVSLICDEVDFTLTSEINFKLAIPVVNTNQEETRILLDYINDFIETPYFKYDVSNEDDVVNLKMFLIHQFKLYNPSYKYPLGELQKQELLESSNPIALKLYKLNKALEKSYKNDDLFDDLINSSLYAKTLEENVHYILPKIGTNDKDKYLKAIPIIKDQPSYGTNFGDAVQSFLHLIIEKKYPLYANKLDISMALSTIFNISPKNFFDYYRLTDGKIIGLTGTAGDKNTITEFMEINKIISFDFPVFKKSLKIIEYKEVANELSQEELMIDIIAKENKDRPIIIFSQNAKEAEKIFLKLNDLLLGKNIQLYSGSLKDTQVNEVEIRKIAGNVAQITVTTPMLGRGTDFNTLYPKGFLAINLCTDITESTLKQIEGRVARAGNEGKIISIFNKEIFGNNIQEFMINKALEEHDIREENQPLTDILQYFNKKNQDQKFNAIKINKFFTKTWKNLLEDQGEKSLLDLKNNLINIAKEKYPKITSEIDTYLMTIDNDNHANIHENFYANYVDQNLSNNNNFLYSIDHFDKEITPEEYFIKLGHSNIFSKIEKPNDNLEYREFYNKIYKANAVTMLTHALTLENGSIKFKDEERIYNIQGEGSGNNLMLDEFKKSFNSYKKLTNSREIYEIAKMIDNFASIQDIDVTKLEYGKYQAINIVTKFNTESSHAESLIMNGKFLFWINRGGDTSVGKPGIKLFKIIKDFDKVKELFQFLKTPQSQTETRSKIYDLLREEGDKNIPEYIQIEMKAQKIGNCGWTQTKGMLKAAAIVAMISNIDDFLEVSSSYWQKILKNSDEIYKDFTSYDRIKRLEVVLYLKDKDFPLEFLDKDEKKEIDEIRDFLENPILPELLVELERKLSETIGKYKNTIYEDQAHRILTKLQLEVAIESDAGKGLIDIMGEENSLILLSNYQKNLEGDFKILQNIYKEISETIIQDKHSQNNIWKQILEYLVETKYNIDNLYSFTDIIRSSIHECSDDRTDCIINKIKDQNFEISPLGEYLELSLL